MSQPPRCIDCLDEGCPSCRRATDTGARQAPVVDDDLLRRLLLALVERWRTRADGLVPDALRDDRLKINLLRECAADLEAALRR